MISYKKYFRVNFIYKKKPYYFKSTDKRLLYSLLRYKLPVDFKIIKHERPNKDKNRHKA